MCTVTAWRSGNGVDHISAVTLYRARLVLRWVIVCGFVCHHPRRPTEPPTWQGNEYWSRGSGSALQLGRFGITLAMRHRLYGVSTCRLSGLRKGGELLIYTPLGSMAPFTCTIMCTKLSSVREHHFIALVLTLISLPSVLFLSSDREIVNVLIFFWAELCICWNFADF